MFVCNHLLYVDWQKYCAFSIRFLSNPVFWIMQVKGKKSCNYVAYIINVTFKEHEAILQVYTGMV